MGIQASSLAPFLPLPRRSSFEQEEIKGTEKGKGIRYGRENRARGNRRKSARIPPPIPLPEGPPPVILKRVHGVACHPAREVRPGANSALTAGRAITTIPPLREKRRRRRPRGRGGKGVFGTRNPRGRGDDPVACRAGCAAAKRHGGRSRHAPIDRHERRDQPPRRAARRRFRRRWRRASAGLLGGYAAASTGRPPSWPGGRW